MGVEHALATWLGVLALGDIVRAPLGIVGDNGDVPPRVRGPVWVVVPVVTSVRIQTTDQVIHALSS